MALYMGDKGYNPTYKSENPWQGPNLQTLYASNMIFGRFSTSYLHTKYYVHHIMQNTMPEV